MLIYNQSNIFPVNTVLSTTRNSIACQLANMTGFSIQIVFTGTPTGSFKLQSSCDPVTKQNEIVGANGVITYTVTNWTDIANSSQSVSAAGNVQWNYDGQVNFNFVRAAYTDSSGGSSTAVITVSTCNAKGM